MDFSLGRSLWRSYAEGIEREWLITNGIGGYANLTITGANARSFSGLLNTSFNPPADRYTCLANVSESIALIHSDSSNGCVDLTSRHCISETLHGQQYLTHFHYDAFPVFTYQVEDLLLIKSIGMAYGENTVCICYTIHNGSSPAIFTATPQFTYKQLGSTITAKELEFTYIQNENRISLTPASSKDTVINFDILEGNYVDRTKYPVSMAVPTHLYQEGILYDLDIRNGLNASDCYYTPYDIQIQLKPGETKNFYFTCSTTTKIYNGFDLLQSMKDRKNQLEQRLSLKDPLLKRLAYSADQFIVERNSTGYKTILAGYPWFLDWGRDTMIAFTGLTLCTHRFEEAESILLSFVQYIQNGLLPNVFPSNSLEAPQYNTMDASLWYFQAVYQYLRYNKTEAARSFVQQRIYPALREIIDFYYKGTQFQIHMDKDFLLAGGDGLDQITWMDVRVGDWVVTPRHGKPVEINALWFNALKIMEELSPIPEQNEYHILSEQVKESFQAKFWNQEENCLYDVITLDSSGHEVKDASIRPNQIFAVSLPFSVLPLEKEAAVVSKVFSFLYTPLGIRSLSSDAPNYRGTYMGNLLQRDASYHMGTSWGYLTGPFLSAYLKVNQHSEKSIKIALQLMQPLVDHLEDGCLGGIAEIFDGSLPCTSRGCYTQAWSIGELIRVYTEDILSYTTCI